MTERQSTEMARLIDSGALDPAVIDDVEVGRTDRRFVYLMESAGLYKIGYARHPARRLASINCGSASPVKLLWQTETDQFTHLERLLHEKFAAKRQRGEWFALDAADLALIRSFVRLPVLLPH